MTTRTPVYTAKKGGEVFLKGTTDTQPPQLKNEAMVLAGQLWPTTRQEHKKINMGCEKNMGEQAEAEAKALAKSPLGTPLKRWRNASNSGRSSNKRLPRGAHEEAHGGQHSWDLGGFLQHDEVAARAVQVIRAEDDGKEARRTKATRDLLSA